MALYPAMSMGERILFIRKNCGDLSQEEFANKLGLTKSAISGYETERRVPPDHVIKHIAHEFNLDEDWLRDGVGDPFFPTPDDALDELFSQFKCSDFERSFLSAYFDMPDKDRHEFSEYLKQFFRKLVEWTVENETARFKVETCQGDVAPKSDSTEAAEADYRSSSGFVQSTGLSASNTTEDTVSQDDETTEENGGGESGDDVG